MISIFNIYRFIGIVMMITILGSCQSANKKINLMIDDVISFGKSANGPSSIVEPTKENNTEKETTRNRKFLPFNKENLEENIRIAIDKHPSVMSKLEQRKVAEKLVEVEISGKSLISSGQLSAGMQSENNTTDPALVATLSASKLVYDFGATDAKIEAKIADVATAETQIELQAEFVAIQALNAWIELNATREKEKIFFDGLQMAKPLLGQIKNISTSGLVDKASLLSAQKKYISLEKAYDQAALQVNAAEAEFKEFFPDSESQLVSDPGVIEIDLLPSENPNHFQNTPAIKNIDLMIKAKAEFLNSVKLSDNPIVALSGSVTAPAKDLKNDGTAIFGFVVNHTFNDGGRRVATVESLKSEIDALKEERASVILSFKTDLKAQVAIYDGVKREYESLQSLIKLTEEVRDASRAQLVSGSSSIEDVMEAEVALADMRIQIISAKSSMSSSSFNIYALTHGLTDLVGWSSK